MKKIEKTVWSQDSYFKTERKYSGETSINLSNDIYRFLGGEDNDNFVFTIYKEDYIKALGVITILLPLYNSTSKSYSVCSYSNNLIESYYAIIQSKFGDSDIATYSVNLFKRDKDSRIYLNQLMDKSSGFNLRNFLIQGHSKLIFIQTDEGSYEIRLESNYVDYSISANYQSYKPIDNYELEQKIYFGSPGSGKSWSIKKKYELKKVDDEYVIDEEKIKRVTRTTFHPDTDYAQFVGCYKPIPIEENNKITYKFVPQAFTDAYVKAWKDLSHPYYLIIEEINRGNCAQIFGDLFQLLDRNKNGYSEYPIKADHDLRNYLEEVLTEDSEGIRDGKICLPPNLSIVASMNTSDQSLFPMDSAFKRRWSWEYVPIKYDEPKSSAFVINIPGSPFEKWVDFLKKINGIILEKTQSEDKQMGNFFIKGNIDSQEFKDKVMFYLWSEVCKDCYQSPENFFRAKIGDNTSEFSYNMLYDEKGDELLVGFLNYIVEYKLKEDKKE